MLNRAQPSVQKPLGTGHRRVPEASSPWGDSLPGTFRAIGTTPQPREACPSAEAGGQGLASPELCSQATRQSRRGHWRKGPVGTSFPQMQDAVPAAGDTVWLLRSKAGGQPGAGLGVSLWSGTEAVPTLAAHSARLSARVPTVHTAPSSSAPRGSVRHRVGLENPRLWLCLPPLLISQGPTAARLLQEAFPDHPAHPAHPLLSWL